MKKIQKVAIYIQIDAIKWKILILEKTQKKRTIKFGFPMIEKYFLQILIPN